MQHRRNNKRYQCLLLLPNLGFAPREEELAPREEEAPLPPPLPPLMPPRPLLDPLPLEPDP